MIDGVYRRFMYVVRGMRSCLFFLQQLRLSGRGSGRAIGLNGQGEIQRADDAMLFRNILSC